MTSTNQAVTIATDLLFGQAWALRSGHKNARTTETIFRFVTGAPRAQAADRP